MFDPTFFLFLEFLRMGFSHSKCLTKKKKKKRKPKWKERGVKFVGNSLHKRNYFSFRGWGIDINVIRKEKGRSDGLPGVVITISSNLQSDGILSPIWLRNFFFLFKWPFIFFSPRIFFKTEDWLYLYRLVFLVESFFIIFFFLKFLSLLFRPRPFAFEIAFLYFCFIRPLFYHNGNSLFYGFGLFEFFSSMTHCLKRKFLVSAPLILLLCTDSWWKFQDIYSKDRLLFT